MRGLKKLIASAILCAVACSAIFAVTVFAAEIQPKRITVEIDYGDYSGFDLPVGRVGKSYPVFDCTATDDLGEEVNSVRITVKNPSGETIAVNGGRFLTLSEGEYKAHLSACINIYVDGSKAESNVNCAPSTKNDLLTGNVFYKGDGDKCGQWSENSDRSIKYTSHNYVDGICQNCGAYNEEKTQGVQYAYDKDKDCYYVGNNTTLNVAEATILSTFNDGIHGEKDVKYVAFGAFQGNGNITKVVLPESVTDLYGGVFLGCNNLTYVSMIGVSKMYATNGNETGGRWGDNNFRNCNKLSTVIVNSSFTVTCGQFNAENLPETLILNLFVDGASGTVKIEGNNALWTGNVFYKGDGDKCGQWSYNSDESIKYTSHNYVDGACENCGESQSKSVTYAYDQTSKSYYVTGVEAGTAETELYIRAKYNDGANGEAAVTFIKKGAFDGNSVIKKVILPESIIRLDGIVFRNCVNLEYVSMTGIAAMAFKNLSNTGIYVGQTEVITDNNFLNCGKLTVLVVGKNFDLYKDSAGAQQFKKTEDRLSACINIYVDGSQAESNVNCGSNDKNDLLTGNIYYYSETSAENCWHYVDGVATLWA